MCIEFDLSGHIEDDEVFFSQRFKRLGQPIEIVHEKLEAVDEPAIGPEANLFHSIFERDELFDVEIGLVLKGLGSWIEVDVKGGAAVELQMGDEGGAKGGLERHGWFST